MSIKHIPATPLPWDDDIGLRGLCIGSGDNPAIASLLADGLDPDRDAAYIAHAANAYPKLVAAIRGLLTLQKGYQVGAPARALLRELGEAS